MHVSLLITGTIGLAFIFPTSFANPCTAVSPPPDVSKKYEPRFSYQMARDVLRRAFVIKRIPSKALAKRQPLHAGQHPTSHTVPFRIIESTHLLINVPVGSPPQEVEVVVDTGSSFT